MTHDKVLYFGYGANKTLQMMCAITGKKPADLKGTPVVLNGYELGIQRFDQIPNIVAPGSQLPVSVRDIIAGAWSDPEKFRTYVIRPGEGQVTGTMWELTPEDRDLVREWELVGDWYEEKIIKVHTRDSKEIEVQTEILGKGQELDHIVDGKDYPPFLNGLSEFERVAEKARIEYLDRMKSMQEGKRLGPEKT